MCKASGDPLKVIADNDRVGHSIRVFHRGSSPIEDAVLAAAVFQAQAARLCVCLA